MIQKKTQAGEIVIEYISSEAQITDIMTKLLHTLQFQNLKVKLTIILDGMSTYGKVSEAVKKVVRIC